MTQTRILVTGGAGFIGSALVRRLVASGRYQVLNFDKVTYAGNLASLTAVEGAPGYAFRRADVCDAAAVRKALREFQPQIVTHLAAESHVDRSIDGPAAFIQTNVVGTFTLLSETLDYWRGAGRAGRESAFRFHHISTDEVFGSLGRRGSVRRGHALCAQVALLGLQGGVRPPRARLEPHLRPAGAGDQLLATTTARTISRRS